jgi:hypothetical protein
MKLTVFFSIKKGFTYGKFFILKKIVCMIFFKSVFKSVLRNFKQQIEFVFNFDKFYVKNFLYNDFYNIVRILNFIIEYFHSILKIS